MQPAKGAHHELHQGANPTYLTRTYLLGHPRPSRYFCLNASVFRRCEKTDSKVITETWETESRIELAGDLFSVYIAMRLPSVVV